MIKNLAENLSPRTKKSEEVTEATQKLRELIKESNSAIETPQLAIEKIQDDQNAGVLYDVSLENTL